MMQITRVCLQYVKQKVKMAHYVYTVFSCVSVNHKCDKGSQRVYARVTSSIRRSLMIARHDVFDYRATN